MNLRTLRGQTVAAFLMLSLGSILMLSLLIHVQVERHLALYYQERVEQQVRRVATALARTHRPGLGWTEPLLSAVAWAQPPEVVGFLVEDDTGPVFRYFRTPSQPRLQDSRESPVEVGDAAVAHLRLYAAITPSESPEAHFRVGVAQAIALTAGLVALLATTAATLVAGRLLRPLEAMTAVARAVRVGDRHARAPRPPLDELRQLADALNDLAAWLQQSEALRRRLTRDVAHQLRTPLAVLRSHLEALRHGVWEPTPERIELCHAQVLQLVRRVEDLDRLVEAEAAVFSLERVDVSLRRLLDPLASSFAPLFARRGLAFEYRPPEPDGVFRVDPDKVAQAVSNLLDNALKYAPPGATVCLEGELTGEEARISVANTGPGLGEDEVPHLFERFFRGQAAHARSAPGTGLGLSIARALAEAHGGTIEVHNRPGHGVTFTVRIPRRLGPS